MSATSSQAQPHLERIENPGPLHAPRLALTATALFALGVIVFGIVLYVSPARAWGAFLQGMMIPVWISLGALFFIAIHSIGNAHWTVPIRRVMEGLTSGIPLTLLAFVGFALFGMSYVYEWANSAGDPRSLFIAHEATKSRWMTFDRCFTTTVIILITWIWLRSHLIGLSLKQDQRLDMGVRHVRWSVIFLLVFALSFTLFVWDLLLSLQVHYVSAVWGIYCIVGVVQTFLAVLTIIVGWLARGPLKDVIRPHVFHDLGTWTVAWSCIWAYIAYSQYVIVYFANMNEESYFYLMRTQHGYGASYAFEAFLRFPIPFIGLMSQRVRSDPRALCVVSAFVLLGCWIDLSWMVMPALSPNHFHGFWELPELLIGGGFVGGFLLLALRFWRQHGLIPEGDPSLLSSINAEHMH